MEQKKRKISIRKVLQFLFSLVIIGCCIVGITSASKIENAKTVRVVDIRIENGNKYHFLDKKQVADMVINNRHIDILNMPMSKVDIQSMERIIAANPWVAKAQVYIDNGRALHLNVTQRIPVVRIFDDSGSSYYLDTTLSAMPLSANYVHYTHVVTNVPVLRDDSMANALKGEIVGLVKFIEGSRFWNTQISQIIMQPDNTFQLVPILGKQQILLGDTTHMAEKFDNLFRFYMKVLNRIGWDKYDVLDLRFRGQVVASPTLPWKAPVDKAMSNMNWVKSIIGNASGNDKGSAVDSVKKVKAPATAMPKATASVSVHAPAKVPADKVNGNKQQEKKTQTNTDKKSNKQSPTQKTNKH